jgi:hypothetical protein
MTPLVDRIQTVDDVFFEPVDTHRLAEPLSVVLKGRREHWIMPL